METLEIVVAIAFWVGALGQVAAAIAMVWVIRHTRQSIDITGRAERLKVFQDFSSRYDTIRDRINPKFLLPDISTSADDIQHDKRSTQAAIEMLNLFDRELFMHNEELIDSATWHVLERGMKKHIHKPFFATVWKHRNQLTPHDKFSPSFIEWMKQNSKQQVKQNS